MSVAYTKIHSGIQGSTGNVRCAPPLLSVSEPFSNNRISSCDNVGVETRNGFLHFSFIQRIDLSDHTWYIDNVYIRCYS